MSRLAHYIGRHHLALLALFVALGGTSYATVLNVPRASVGTPELKRNAVKAAKIAPNAVRTAHVLNGSLLAADFKAGQLPQGPKGEKGEKGEKGPAGERGPVGISGYEIVSSNSGGSSETRQAATANCPADKKVVGGGAYLAASAATWFPVALDMSQPAGSGTGWMAGAREITATSGTWAVYVYAVCANIDS